PPLPGTQRNERRAVGVPVVAEPRTTVLDGGPPAGRARPARGGQPGRRGGRTTARMTSSYLRRSLEGAKIRRAASGRPAPGHLPWRRPQESATYRTERKPMIEAVDLTKRYGEKLAVDSVSFTVRPGRVT